MELKIRCVSQRRTGEERLLIDVEEVANLGEFVVIDTTYDEENEVSNKNRHFYSFQKLEVSPGDLIRLYTRAHPQGLSYVPMQSENKKIIHTFYWGFEEGYSVWNNDGDFALVIKIADHHGSRV